MMLKLFQNSAMTTKFYQTKPKGISLKSKIKKTRERNELNLLRRKIAKNGRKRLVLSSC